MRDELPAAFAAVPEEKPSVRCASFPPIEDATARVLILGSMPGKASLRAHQYYAHPRNAFWPIMGALFDAGPALSYEERSARLKRAGIALWDVLASCTRASSLDADIDETSIVTNDFRTFLAAHPCLDHVFFNGAKAEDAFRKHVRPQLADASLRYARLPSTSPANASRAFPEKLDAWRVLRSALNERA